MFSKLISFSMLALPLLAVATPVERNTPTTACCASTEPASSAAGAAILKAIGVDLGDLNVLLGLTCSPISVVGVGSGSECSGTTVSCSDGIVGSIGVGCIPVSA